MTGRPVTSDPGLVEVADRVWVARHPGLGVTVAVVGGERGLLVLDTRGSARPVVLADDLRRLGSGVVVAVVNTHAHLDHTLGNADPGGRWPAPLIAHEQAATIVPADETFSSVRAVDLGDRVVELVHPGRGHTAGDLVARVPDADVLVAGDLVAGSASPSYGPDCFPLDWPTSLDLVLGLVGEDTLVVPGHGEVVDQGFVQQQRADIGVVAETIYDFASRSVPLEGALRHADWPFPSERLGHGVRRGYGQVPRTARRLPLV